MVHTYLDSKLTQPDSSNSSDCENNNNNNNNNNSDLESLDTILSSLLSNLTLNNKSDEMTIKKYKKDRIKHDRSEIERENRDKALRFPHNTHSASSGDSPSHFLCQSDLRHCNYDSTASVAKRARSVFHSDCVDAQRDSKVTESFTEHNNSNSGNNSEDEYYMATGSRNAAVAAFQVEESEMGTLLRERRGWKIILVGTDGACLFRAVAHQIFGDEEKHLIIREQVINYMKQNREHFSQFISEDFDHYLLRKLDAHTHGNHVEIQAISELYNRPVEIYYNSLEPINVFHREYTDLPPLRLSYHGGIHYNSIVDPQNPTYGEGLGMPNYQPKLSESELVEKAKNESETSQIEDTILQERLKLSENQAIERSIEEQVAQESYLEYLTYLSSQTKSRATSSSLSHCAAAGGGGGGGGLSQSPNEDGTVKARHRSPTTTTSSSSTAASCSYNSRGGGGGRADYGLSTSSSSSTRCNDNDKVFVNHLPAEVLDMDEEDVLAMVLENSRREYIASLSTSKYGNFGDTEGGGGARD